MASSLLKLEDYPAVADFMITSFERDLPDFSKYYKGMDDAYLTAFKASNASLKAAPSGLVRKKKQTGVTKLLYNELDETKKEVIFLNDYAKRAELDVTPLTKTVKEINTRNTEGVIKLLRDALPYYEEHAAEMIHMPEGFLTTIKGRVTEIETLNATQDSSMNEKKSGTNATRQQYDEVYGYISEVAKAGKLIYKGTPKADEYTISALLSRLHAAKRVSETVETVK
jgi:hypothetical protein